MCSPPLHPCSDSLLALSSSWGVEVVWPLRLMLRIRSSTESVSLEGGGEGWGGGEGELEDEVEAGTVWERWVMSRNSAPM